MSDFQEKTEAPTPKRRQKAREDGEVARSQEVSTAVLLLVGAGIVHFGAARVAGMLTDVFGYATQVAAVPPSSLSGNVVWLRQIGWQVLGALVPVMLFVVLGSALVGAVQARGVLSWKPLRPNFKRISPLRNARNIYGVRSIAELLKSLLKLVLIGVVVYSVLKRGWLDLLALPQQSPGALMRVIHANAARLLLVSGLVYLVVAAADYAFQLWQHEKKLRMSRREVKDEQKETEGDQMVKARIRSLGRAFARQRMMAAVPTADVVITNPTKIAVALRYDPEQAAAPVVVAMGERKIAERIRQIARESGVQIVENRPLARALLATAKVGLPIPEELYMAVAEVLAFVYRQRAMQGGRA